MILNDIFCIGFHRNPRNFKIKIYRIISNDMYMLFYVPVSIKDQQRSNGLGICKVGGIGKRYCGKENSM
jgi:hypothetical protein